MLARCTRCRSTFFTDEYGLQRCPNCNAQVLIADPNAPQDDSVPDSSDLREESGGPRTEAREGDREGEREEEQKDDREKDLEATEIVDVPDVELTVSDVEGPGGSTPPQSPDIPAWYRLPPQDGASDGPGEPPPWERQDELGFVRAFFDTVGAVLGNPERIFGRMNWAIAPSAHTYYLLVAVMPAVLGRIIAMQLEDPAATMQALEEAIQGVPEANREAVRQFAELFAMSEGPGLIGTIIGLPLLYFLALYIGAGVAHLLLLLLGEVRSGWTGTFKAFVYGSTPLLFAIVPVCGATVAQFWTMGLCVYGLMKAQRTKLGYALFGVVGLPLLFCCCAGIGMAVVVGLMANGGAP